MVGVYAWLPYLAAPASLDCQERAAILGALQREVVRVHKQLAPAAAELRPGGGKLAQLQTWDVAYSQVCGLSVFLGWGP